MNLVKKTNTYYLLFLLLIFPVMIVVDYFLIRYLVNNEVEEILLHEKERIEFQLRESGKLPESTYLLNFIEIPPDYPLKKDFSDTLMYEPYAKKRIPYRTYKFKSTLDSKSVQITLKHILLEVNELIWLLFLTTSVILLLLGLGLYFINNRIYQWAWNPFFKNLVQLKNYNVSQKESIRLQESSIHEFEELNQVISKFVHQIKKDFQHLKEFNENISHEIQTPLAIIRNKVVSLLESKNLDDKEQQRVEAIYREANKLSKIEKSLTLISRIENLEFKKVDQVEVHTMLDNILSNMKEMIDFKNIQVTVQVQPLTIQCDHILADILLTNLIKNAVEHNFKGGSLKIVLNQNRLQISNTGRIPEVPVDRLFERFQKGNKETDSLGLGLAINQKICEIYGFHLEYDQKGEIHTFLLSVGYGD